MTPWLPWLYHYGVGGLVFAATILLLVRAGAFRLSHRTDWAALLVLVAGLLGFLVLHAAWILWAAGG